MISKFGVARRLIHPRVRRKPPARACGCCRCFCSYRGAGLLVIGQTVSWLTRVGAIDYLGTIMVIVVVRELGPLATALLVLARIGTANVIELGTARAMGEVEALEAWALTRCITWSCRG